MHLEEDLLVGADVVVVDDEPANVALVGSILERNGFTRVRSTTDAREFRGLFDAKRPDIVLLDLHMPYLSGVELLREVSGLLAPDEYLPIVVLSADVTAKARRDALGAGATDFLTKPFDATEVVQRVLNHLQTRRIHRRLREQEAELAQRLRAETRRFEQWHLESLRRLPARADHEGHDHTARVGTAAGLLARSAGLDTQLVALLEQAAPLHDLGKVGVPDAVLLKPGRLSPGEFAVVRRHTTLGGQIIGETPSELLGLARVIAETHHERWNGAGYPAGLRGEAIPLVGRVVAVCDVFDALTHDRPYDRAWSVDAAVAELVGERGRFFDPDLVDLFVDRVVPALPRAGGPAGRADGSTTEAQA